MTCNSRNHGPMGDPAAAVYAAVDGRCRRDCVVGTHTLTDAEANLLNW